MFVGSRKNKGTSLMTLLKSMVIKSSQKVKPVGGQ